MYYFRGYVLSYIHNNNVTPNVVFGRKKKLQVRSHVCVSI
jgi:hypothetical protein